MEFICDSCCHKGKCEKEKVLLKVKRKQDRPTDCSSYFSNDLAKILKRNIIVVLVLGVIFGLVVASVILF